MFEQESPLFQFIAKYFGRDFKLILQLLHEEKKSKLGIRTWIGRSKDSSENEHLQRKTVTSIYQMRHVHVTTFPTFCNSGVN